MILAIALILAVILCVPVLLLVLVAYVMALRDIAYDLPGALE